MFLRKDPISSPNSKKVDMNLNTDFSRDLSPEIGQKISYLDYFNKFLLFLWKYFIIIIWKPFLLLIGFPIKSYNSNDRIIPQGHTQIYQLDVWDINEASLALFS